MQKTVTAHLAADEALEVAVHNDVDDKPYGVIMLGSLNDRVVIFPDSTEQILDLATKLFGLAADIACAETARIVTVLANDVPSAVAS